MGFFKDIKKLQKTVKKLEKATQEKTIKKDSVERYRLIGGENTRMTEDEIEINEACDSENLDKMLNALKLKATWIDRHYLLHTIVKVTYKLRKGNPKMKELCKNISEMHLKEFPAIVPSLKKDNEGYLPPQVATFKHYATILTEHGEYDRAIEVCEMAISYDLCDGTRGGYEGRLERIRKTAEKARKGNKENPT